MSRLRVNSTSFEERYGEKSKALLELARTLPERPSPTAIHDLRVTARRIQVMFRLLPKRARSSETSMMFALVLRSILKSTSQLRDLDTLMETLEPYRAELPAEVFLSLENERSDSAARAKAAMEVLAEAPSSDLDTSEIRGKRLSRRLRKRVRRHGRRAAELLGDVLEDESKVKDLHALRIEVKKLRYLLELGSKIPPELPVMTKWQDSLGAIHDLDVAMDYIQRNRLDFTKDRVIHGLRGRRHSSYVKFVSDFGTDSMAALGSSKVLASGPPSQLP
ncbi:MAG: CHAD domain-containing protein [Thaumarchaeota archaeon]|nr:CHAD domain-containing protein [Nitrososphaerota archaeon]